MLQDQEAGWTVCRVFKKKNPCTVNAQELCVVVGAMEGAQNGGAIVAGTGFMQYRKDASCSGEDHIPMSGHIWHESGEISTLTSGNYMLSSNGDGDDPPLLLSSS